ncbi:MAG: chromosome segregation protein [Gaiellaceae bacterium]|nr:chromosome segregation protein [Gaiellaceae bacterium]
MHLRAIKLRGFKSVPDPVEVRLEPGVAVVVGPNGSGKSNVSDGIVWAAGSLSPSELRAEKPDDVLFAGSVGRKAADFCEVELLFDNQAGDGPTEFSELSIARRLHRGGEGQYLVNKASVRRLDLVELLADLGLGGGMHSIIGQGKVEEILASKPDERRALIEEAAGLGRFKQRRRRAELKLARVAIQVERARDLEAEVKARLRPLALQATAAERAEKLGHELARLRARLAELELAGLEERRSEAGERKAAAALARRRTEERLEALLGERGNAEEELADAAGRREQAVSALYRLRSAGERLVLRRESADELVARLAQELAEAEAAAAPREGPSVAELERAAAAAAQASREAALERDSLGERSALAVQRLGALERSLAEREGLPPAARTLAEAGEQLALALLEVDPGYERAVAAALGRHAAALVAKDPPAGLALLERVREGGLGSVTVLAGSPEPAPVENAVAAHVHARPGGEAAARILEGVALVELPALLDAQVPSVTREGHGYDPLRGELWFAGETAEAVLLELEARRRALAAEAEDLAGQAESAGRVADEAAGRAAEAGRVLARVEPSLRARLEPAILRRLGSAAGRLAAALVTGAEAAARFEAPLRARVDAGAVRTTQLAEDLRRLGGGESELRRAAAEASERAGAVDVELARLDAEAAEARRRLEEAGAEPAEGDDREAIAEKVERLERRRETLGRVNPLAKEEYDREKERLEELATQRADLEQSLEELEKLAAELADTVERRFAETFDAVQANFAEVAGTLFPGGEGKLTLVEPEEEGEQPGIEVELRPAGKRVTRLSLLSGGEKALGAISFLFALFLARPCPFYLLDEVEAALDDTNIGRFVELLRRYADRAQFVVITHQKRTMEAADVLYGVTMGGDGVSQVVSRRLPREQAVEAAAS